MLGTRTKQVNAYGKRGHRIVNVSDDRDRSKASSFREPSTTYGAASSTESDVAPQTSSRGMKSRGRVNSTVASSSSSSASSSSDSSPEPVVRIRQKESTSRTYKASSKLARPQLNQELYRKPLSNVSANVPPMRTTGGQAAPSKVHRKSVAPGLGKRTPPKQRINRLTPISPVVDVEITVLDASGNPVRRERRVSRPDVQTNNASASEKTPTQVIHRPRAIGKSKQSPIVLSDDDSESVDSWAPSVRPRKRPALKKKTLAPITVSDDDSDVEVIEAPSQAREPLSTPGPRRPPVKHRSNIVLSSPESPELVLQKQPAMQTIDSPYRDVIPANRSSKPKSPTPPSKPVATDHKPPAYNANTLGHNPVRHSLVPLQRNAIHFSPLVRTHPLKGRALTPYRSKLSRASFRPPSSPPSSGFSDEDDISLDLDSLSLSPTTLGQLNSSFNTTPVAHDKPPPSYLKPLLEACSQTTPHEFSAFIEMFPHDAIVRTSHGGVGISPVPSNKKSSKAKAYFQKIGEASFSEVYGIGDVVLKVIPLRDEEATGLVVDDDDSPAPSDVKDVVREIIVTRAMGEMCEGFVQLLRTYVVRGKYPSVLLDLWDEYDERKGSESARPDGFGVSQLYAIIVLPNGGPDLETFTFSSSSKTGWTQACSLFWQVTRALAEAEDLVHFEHRDLHWGQILVKTITDVEPPRVVHGRKVPMDDDAHGVRATVIDLGLSRMESGDANGLHFTVPDEEVFEGEGEYQFDVYRMMRVHNGNSWRPYRPLSNVMWLHYLVLKLLHEKRLRAAPAPRKTSSSVSSTFTERECYLSLVEMEGVLRNAVASCIPLTKKGRRKTAAVAPIPPSGGPTSASDVLEMGVTRGWVSF